jgi:phospholipid/cholesterol/gamma-HCH transport system ATP-binding protein
LIQLKSVYKSFDRPVLRGVNLEIPKGCLYGLIGPGAAGKSLVLKIMTGLVRPDAGRIWVAGQNVVELEGVALQALQSRIGMLFQNNALFDFMTVAENVGFPLRRLFNLDAGEIEQRVRERLERVALSGFEDRLPAGLSGGQKKRVGVARATVTRAGLILYDEPAAGLDPVTSQRIFELLRAEQRQTEATVVMVSSDLDRLLTVTDRVGMMFKGRLIFDGTTAEAYTSDNPYVHQFVHGHAEGPL